ncbi:trypsin 3A1-like isoform X2 [Hermetia illucens]|uniref:trypsin 3A1-like isoform X2 n=1 Tax=Hermetia illucens TaxID=343691 RepID=UPI0018CC692F|nr:trypsin 3A1-like isoform X2 [Hermetia illucens]
MSVFKILVGLEIDIVCPQFLGLFVGLFIFTSLCIELGSEKSVSFLISGGEFVSLGEYPAMVTIRVRTIGHYCGASIIEPQHVLTVAHCLYTMEKTLANIADYELLAGTTHQNLTNPDVIQRLQIYACIIHPEFNYEVEQNDIAVIRLRKPIRETFTVAPVRIALETPPDGTRCYYYGWGRTTNSNVAIASPVLLKVEVKIYSISLCRYKYVYPETQICAGRIEGGKGSCMVSEG